MTIIMRIQQIISIYPNLAPHNGVSFLAIKIASVKRHWLTILPIAWGIFSNFLSSAKWKLEYNPKVKTCYPNWL